MYIRVDRETIVSFVIRKTNITWLLAKVTTNNSKGCYSKPNHLLTNADFSDAVNEISFFDQKLGRDLSEKLKKHRNRFKTLYFWSSQSILKMEVIKISSLPSKFISLEICVFDHIFERILVT